MVASLCPVAATNPHREFALNQRPSETKATLLDWAWVEMMVMQAMVGVLPPEVYAVGLSEKESEWVITYFVQRPVAPNIQEELLEVAGDAELYLAQSPSEPTPTSAAIRKPIRSVVVESVMPLRTLNERYVDRVLFGQRQG